MGAFFSNINLHTGNLNPEVIRSSLINYLKGSYLKNGYVETDKEEEADRSVIISPSHKGPWITIYDEEFENLTVETFDEVATELSNHFKTKAIGIVVHDSDMFMLNLFNEGILANSVHNMNEDGSHTEFDSEKWLFLVPSQVSLKKLQSLCKKDFVFQEDRISKIAEILKMDTDLCLTGYEYVTENSVPETHTILNLKKVAKEQNGKTSFEPVTLKFMAYPGEISGKLQEEHKLQFTIVNHGASVEGLRVTIVGDVLEKELAEFTSMQLRKWNGNEFIEFNQVFEPALSTQDQKLLIATFDDFSLNEGYHPGYPMTSREYKKYIEAYLRFFFHAEITYKGLKPSLSKFQVFFTPLTNNEGYCYEEFGLKLE